MQCFDLVLLCVLFVEDVVYISDGGGVVCVVLWLLYGVEWLVWLYQQVVGQLFGWVICFELVMFNGVLVLLIYEGDWLGMVLWIEIDEDGEYIVVVYVLCYFDKLVWL